MRLSLGRVEDRPGSPQTGVLLSNFVQGPLATATSFNIPFGLIAEQANFIRVQLHFSLPSVIAPGNLLTRASTDGCVTANTGNGYSFTNIASYGTGTAYKVAGTSLGSSVLLDNTSTISWGPAAVNSISGFIEIDNSVSAIRAQKIRWQLGGFGTATNYVSVEGNGIFSVTIGHISGLRLETGATSFTLPYAEVWAYMGGRY